MHYLTTKDTLQRLRELEESGSKLIGIEGLLLHSDGRYEAQIDLIFATSNYEEAKNFVASNDAASMRWDIASESVSG